MTINKINNFGKLTLLVEGRLETITAPELEAVIKNELDGVTELIFDFSKLEYVSSAGLRVLLQASKTMNEKGSMKVINANEIVSEIFAITGFDQVLNIE